MDLMTVIWIVLVIGGKEYEVTDELKNALKNLKEKN